MSERRQLHFGELDVIRGTRGRSSLLFITDRCPVGCAHCSVDSKATSPSIKDFELFDEILDWLCEQREMEVVGISGGEPFVERRGLTRAVERLGAADKQLVLYTSGVWASASSTPRWIAPVLERASTVFLSTDAFHQDQIADDTYIRAARAIAAAGAWIIVQVIGLDGMVERADGLLRATFGDDFSASAELRVTPALTAGRGANVFTTQHRLPGRAFPSCAAVASPIIRYDGVATACCNESVIMGWGPPRLRRATRSRDELDAAMRGFHEDPLLKAIGGPGPRVLTALPQFADLAETEFASVCDLCWKVMGRSAQAAPSDRLLDAISVLG
jgi:Radical SAM superfamily/4Fe-4S single cluster domain